MYFNKPDDRLLKNVIVDTQGKATLYDNVTRAAPHAPNLRAVNFWPTSWAAVGLTDQAGGNYRLAASSPYNNAATDGRDIGADIDMIALSTAGATSGNWGSAFAQMMGTSLLVSFDGTNTPITLAKSGSNITVTRGRDDALVRQSHRHLHPGHARGRPPADQRHDHPAADLQQRQPQWRGRAQGALGVAHGAGRSGVADPQRLRHVNAARR
jgi:hypothetical protein